MSQQTLSGTVFFITLKRFFYGASHCIAISRRNQFHIDLIPNDASAPPTSRFCVNDRSSAHHRLHRDALTGRLNAFFQRNNDAGRLLIECPQLLIRDRRLFPIPTPPFHIRGKNARLFPTGYDREADFRQKLCRLHESQKIPSTVITNSQNTFAPHTFLRQGPKTVIHPKPPHGNQSAWQTKTPLDLWQFGFSKEHRLKFFDKTRNKFSPNF